MLGPAGMPVENAVGRLGLGRVFDLVGTHVANHRSHRKYMRRRTRLTKR